MSTTQHWWQGANAATTVLLGPCMKTPALLTINKIVQQSASWVQKLWGWQWESARKVTCTGCRSAGISGIHSLLCYICSLELQQSSGMQHAEMMLLMVNQHCKSNRAHP